MTVSLVDQFFSFLYKNDKKGHIVRYNQDGVLIKKGHIPLMAYRLLKGSVQVFKDDKFIGEFGEHTCWGMNEIMNDKISTLTVWIKKDSIVCAIGKSELQKTWMKVIHLFESDMLDKLMHENAEA